MRFISSPHPPSHEPASLSRTRPARASSASISASSARTTAIPVAPLSAAITRRRRCWSAGTSTLKRTSRPGGDPRVASPPLPPWARLTGEATIVGVSSGVSSRISSARLIGAEFPTARAIRARASFALGLFRFLVSAIALDHLLRLERQQLRRHVLVFGEVLYRCAEGLRVE